MGQQQSAEKGSSSKSTSIQPDRDRERERERDRRVNRRVSIQALTHGRAATPVDPSASQEIAVAHTTSQHLEKAPLQQFLQNSSSPEHNARAASKVERSTSGSSRHKKQEIEHRPKEPRHQIPVPVPHTSGPMDVPASRSKQETIEERFEEHRNAYNDRRYTPVAQTRPPRLPLPIADVSIPESPTILPADRSNADIPIFETDDPLSALEPELRRKSSMLSEATTRSEEDVGDELQPFPVENNNSQTVPTVIEWNHGGHKVYVTGTFANWEKKYRLHQRSVSLYLIPHHTRMHID